MYQIIKDLAPLSRIFCSEEYDKSINYLCNLLSFKVYPYTKENEHNGWIIPSNWKLIDAQISSKGKLIYDGKHHPLAVPSHSTSVEGEFRLEELKKHLFYDHRNDEAIPYHFRYSYRPWERNWGFCLPKQLYENLTADKYFVVIKTEERTGTLNVLEYDKKGKLEDTYVFVAHLDHPGMANDDLSGCAVAINFFRAIQNIPTKYSYKLLIVPEIIGSEFYLNELHLNNDWKIKEGIFLESLGTNTPLALQSSNKGESIIEYEALTALQSLNVQFSSGPYASIIGNDEIVFESYGIPMCSLSRCPFPQYHSSLDNISIINIQALDESLKVLLEIFQRIETNKMISKKLNGFFCLANPQYDLYTDLKSASEAFANSEVDMIKFRNLMDFIPTIKNKISIKQLAKSVDLDESIVINYLQKWQEKKLIDII
ncbi:MAG: DUF4910 domain-containing protein [Oligoflexia bacterium]|nr:DUF4910 domain-containing protein [Oligoflexia bacterium]